MAIAETIGKSRRTVQLAINKLREQGKIERIGNNKNGKWIVKNNLYE